MKVNDSLLVLLTADMVKNLQFPHRQELHSATSQAKPKAAYKSIYFSLVMTVIHLSICLSLGNSALLARMVIIYLTRRGKGGIGEGVCTAGPKHASLHMFSVFYNSKETFKQTDLRGVLGNKCAGHHNLKRVKIRDIVWKQIIQRILFCT
jgi:hypothetical protein